MYPCSECRENIGKHHWARIGELSKLISTRDCKLWVYFLHNDVNRNLKKKAFLEELSRTDLISSLDEIYGSTRCTIK